VKTTSQKGFLVPGLKSPRKQEESNTPAIIILQRMAKFPKRIYLQTLDHCTGSGNFSPFLNLKTPMMGHHSNGISNGYV
jgi:hypothetical protein